MQRGLFESGGGGHVRERKWSRGVSIRHGRTIRRLHLGRMNPEFAPKQNMNWIDRAERKFGHLAIPHLIRVIAGFNILVFVLYKGVNPHFLSLLTLNPEAIMRGQVWRLVTYIFIPSIGGPLFDWLAAAFYIWFIWWLGDGLESAMGSFRVNLFYLIGMIGTTVAAFYTGANFATAMVNSTLFFAFAAFIRKPPSTS